MSDVSPDLDNIDSVIEIPTTSQDKDPAIPREEITFEIKKMLIEALENGACDRKTAATIFNVSYKRVCQIYNRFLKTGVITKNKKTPETSKKLNGEIVDYLSEVLAENCAYTYKQLQEMVKSKYSVDVGLITISKEIRESFHYNLKRIKRVLSSDDGTLKAKERKNYCERFLRLLNSGRMLIYFDEAEFKVTIRQFHKRLPHGQKNSVAASPLKTKLKTIMVSMTQSQLLYYEAQDGKGTEDRTLEHIEGLMGLLSRHRIARAVVIMDRQGSRNIDCIEDLIVSSGHELMLLPANSSFFNPVEKMLSQWDTLVRHKNPKNEIDLDRYMESLTGNVNSRLCQNYWDHAMYNISSCINGKLICMS